MTQREVVLEGGLPWGFRMHGGSDTKTPLKISRVNPGSKAAQRGVREGDLITTINGQNTRNLTNNEAHNLLKTSGSTLRLGLNEDTEGSPKRRLIKTVRQENHQETIQKSSTLYSLKETIESLPKKQQNNESGQTKQHRRFVNGQEVKENGGNAVVVTNVPVSQRSTSSSSSISTPSTLIPEGKTFSTDQAEVSRQSSYSNCSSIPDEGGKEGDETEVEDMNDGQERISKSKRRRQRRKNLLHRSTSQENRPVVEINEVTEETIKELPEETEEEEPVKSPEPDAPTKNIEILKLKRIEHKYKVESPKELKIEQIKSKDKKLKTKSKSLDDDDLLKIQELSEASESEDTKLPPDNVVISEASSEENLIENSQREKRSALSTISLRLNDENEIETISRISCQEEQQLRNFLGGLKLIDSPEESAKEVYERTNETENSKTKKHQARKELEQYFLPMAQNPRFLDAISEEASDISDKESQAGFHAEKNPKQGTPELEIKPPPIPPRRNKSKLLEMYASHPEQPEAVLVETKIIDTQNVQQDICGTTTLAKSPEIAEIVYIDESSDSSRSSNEQIDCISSNLKESQEAETNSQKTDVSSDIFHVQANESTTTTFSSHVTSNSNILKPTENAPTVVDAALLSELTPPPSPENNKSQNHKSTDGCVLKHILFDYTRVPNVLTQKEPDSGFKSLKRNDVECYRSELNTNSIKTVETNTETKSLSSLHSSKEIVNGEIKNIDVIKVKVDERTQNGNSEIYKSLEEYNNNTDSKSSEDNNTPKKLDENVLKHIMMVSKDSNKTDNEKLLEFQSICKLNSELKDKISKQERFGAMRSQIINEKLKKDVEVETEEENEYAPTKNLVQRRVKEFSRQISDEQSVNVVTETERKNSSLIQSRVAQFSETGESLDKINRDDASLVKKVIPSENDNVNKIDEDTGSVLKKILLSREKEDTIFSIPTKEEENKELVVPIKVEKDVSSSETEVIPIKIEQQSESVKKDQHLQGKYPNKETIIPITIEENDGQKKLDNSISKTNENIKEINKYMENISTNEKSIEITSCDHVERNIPTQIEDPKDTSIKELKNTAQSVEDVAINKNLIETESVDDIKKNIPIRAEDFSIRSIKEHKNIRPSVETLSAHHQLTSSSSVAPVERNIPVKIEYSNLETGKKLRDISKSMDNLTINKHPERNIPIKIQHSDLKTMKELKGISKSIENISVKELFNDSKSAVSVVRNIPIRIEDSSSKILKDLNNISKSVENIPINIYLLETKSIVQRNNSDTASKLMKETKDVSKSLENLSTSRRVLETESIKPMERNIPIEIEDSGSKIIKDITQNITLNKKMDETKPARNVERYIPIKTEDSMHEKTATKPSANIERIIPVKIDDASEKSIKKLKGTSKSLENISLNTKLFETKTASKVEKHIPIEIEANSSKSVKNEQGEEDKRIPENQETVHMNVLSPPRRDSVSSESSGESSRCTAKYNPNSSIADISSLTKEEQSGGIKILYEPMSLRSIVLNLLMSLPFGEEILKELADVSKTIESYTNKLPYIFNKILPRKDNVNKISAMPSTWYTEKDIYHNQSEQNNRKLIEHQEHFYTRRKSEGDNIVERENEVMSPNRLLTIIREEPTETEASNESIRLEDNSRERLKAKNLGEWLTLARNKSKSTSQLDSTNIPINNLRRTFSNTEPDRARFSNRRSSLPQEIYEQQLWSIMEKEREIQRELGRLEDEKRKIQAELAPSKQKQFQVNDFFVSKKGDFAEFREQEPRTRPASMPVFPTEYFRQQMYNEYMDKFTEREERKQQKVIKISSSNDLEQDTSFCMKSKEIIHPVELEKEFMDKVKSKKLGRSRGDTDDNEESDDSRSGGKTGEPPVIVLDGDQVKGVDVLPRHLREFVDDLENYQDDSIWSPGQQHPPPTPRSKRTDSQNSQHQRDEPISPVWAPKSASSSPIVERKEFRSVNFRSPVLSRKNRTQSESLVTPDRVLSEPPWKLPEGSSDAAINLSSTLDRRLPNSQSSPGFGSYSTTPRLPRAQNPTIILLQKAREGQLPRGAQYIDQERKPPNDRPPIKYPGEVLYHIKNEYTSESDSEKPRKMADLAPRKFEGIGPTTKDGMPLILRSEVKDRDQSKWYKRMYDTIHKQKPHRDEFVTIKYRQKRAQYPYTSGYLSEPEPGAYDSDFTEYKYATLDRRRPPETNYLNTSAIMSRNITDKSYSSSDIVKNTQETFKIQPGKIENYVPGHSSISEKEAKKWWDEVMDIFDGHLEQQSRIPPQKPRSFINQALKESGYESDSTLIFKRKEDTANQLSPKEQREAYKIIQKGGDVPFQGLRKLAPERPKETDLVEFYPLSPTLTKIRIHKSMIPPQECIMPPKEYLCYPVTVHHNVPKTFASFKRTAPSMASPGGTSIPSPPKRKSSRNNTTLRLISTMKVEKSPTGKRHETCFTSGSSVERTKVNYLKDKITCKLSPAGRKKGDGARMSVVKKVSASPELKSKITSTLSTSRDHKSSVRRVQSSTRVSTDKSKTTPFGGIYKSGSTGSIISKKSSTENLSCRTPTPVKTFGTEKGKFDLKLPKLRDTKSPGSEELLSPTEVKKGIRNISNPNAQYKKSVALLSSAKANNTSASVPIKVGITEKGKSLLKSSIKRPLSLSPKTTRRITISPCPSTSSERSRIKSSTESLASTKSIKKPDKTTVKTKNKPEDKKNNKSKKDTTTKQVSKKTSDSKCLSKATGADLAKKLDLNDRSEIVKQKEAIQSNHFFRNLFMRGLKHSASFTLPRTSWIVERTNQLQRRRSMYSEPSIGAMKIYLKHTKPVTDSKFVSLDIIRSRSASPKSVTFCDTSKTSTTKRSKSLPTRIVFSETSRPVSPVVTRKKILPILKSSSRENINALTRTPSPQTKFILTETTRPISPVVTKRRTSPVLRTISKEAIELVKRTPSPQTKLFFSETTRPVSPEVRRKTPGSSPILPRAPSCRKIMQLKQNQSFEPARPQEFTLYSCPELKHSTTSLDSFRSEDYQIYLKDIGFSSPKSEKFKDLNHFYSDIEKVGQLEQKCSLKPRKKCEEEIIDYDRWMEVRSRERAEHELKHLYHHLKAHEKEKGFLFLPKDVERFRWKKELDRGLRIKEKSVENIKEEFERIKEEESDLENARRRQISYSKDTYKPLWRGNSVVSLASILSERRSQSEGRVKTNKQKLLDDERMLTHGIGSRIWSSLSMEQVNNLKRQLQDIYGDETSEKTDPSFKDYTVDVPKEVDRKYIPTLTIRRNSESSKPDAMNEDEKKMISQMLSKEALEKIIKKRKEDKLALPVMVGKEVLGAVATQEAIAKKPSKIDEPPTALVKTNALLLGKQSSVSETESASTDESTRTVINIMDVQKKVEYFEKAKNLDTYIPTVYQPADDGSSHSEESQSPTQVPEEKSTRKETTPTHSKSCQNIKEFFGESELVKFATLPLSATKKSNCTYTKKPQLRALDISPIRTISEANSVDSLSRSRSISPYFEEAQTLTKKGEVRKIKKQFEFLEDFFGEKKLQRSRSENDLRTYGHVEDLRRKYEYPVHSGRGRSRTKRGGVVSPVWLRPEDRYMPHINIISKIASLYSFSKQKSSRDASRSMEELAEILGCPIGEVEKMKEKFDKMCAKDQISLMGHMYTSSPNLKELRDITPYLTANWIAHKYPRIEDNTRSLSSPDNSIAFRDVSLVRRGRSSSPIKKGQQSILKRAGERRRDRERFESSVRYSKEPEIPPPPTLPQSLGEVQSQDPESPRKYVENEVTIHYKTPVRTEIKEYVSEDELAYRQAEAMKKIYEEEKRRKQIQELQDMRSRRHTDNFVPSQKSPISLNRYDDFDDLTTTAKIRPRSPEPRLVAKALYNFVGHTARELTFRKGELIYLRRQIDKNWYEGELNAMVGLFPVNYVEIVPYEGVKTVPRKAHEGQARAKYNFLAQTHLELSLAKGELVTVTRKVDDNWFEGKIGGRKGIFPVAYVEVLIDPSVPSPPSTKPVASPAAHSLLLNGSAQGKESMGSHLYTPNLPNPLAERESGFHRAKPVQLSGAGTYTTLPKSTKNPLNQTLHIETQSEPIPYRALYKYTPQNDDELELLEGDTVYVLEKCDDGWYVGSSDRTGGFGTFPGNYVEKI